MAGVVVDTGKVPLMDTVRTNSPLSGCKFAMFTNVITPVHGTVIGDLVEAAFTGYSRITLSSWAAAVLTADFHAKTVHPTITFTNTGGSDSTAIQGWFLVDSTGTFLISAGLWPAAIIIPAGGSFVAIPTFSDTSEF